MICDLMELGCACPVCDKEVHCNADTRITFDLSLRGD